MTFPLLSDPGSMTIRKYGIFNTTIPADNQQSYGIPFPGTFMLNAQGTVTARFFEQAYQERSTVGSILARLGNNVQVPAMKISSPQIEITSFVTDATVAPGTHLFDRGGRPTGARRSRIRARRNRVQADRTHRGSAARARRARQRVPAPRRLLLQTLERTRQGILEALSHRPGPRN